ncbi:hypothetical protein ACN9MB_09155 [Dyella kyungheensis]|uniref:hypothetical protein n=1 Tax=Dyella kyungheensis TaxID=1242174 RepID=UPI003CEE54C9
MNDDLENKVALLTEKVDSLSTQIAGLVEAWNTARGVVRFVKFIGMLATAVTATWALFQLGSHK